MLLQDAQSDVQPHTFAKRVTSQLAVTQADHGPTMKRKTPTTLMVTQAGHGQNTMTKLPTNPTEARAAAPADMTAGVGTTVRETESSWAKSIALHTSQS